jgi:hypothetical protein
MLAVSSLTKGGSSVGVGSSRAEAKEFLFVIVLTDKVTKVLFLWSEDVDLPPKRQLTFNVIMGIMTHKVELFVYTEARALNSVYLITL